jgi:hypothetical protein
VVPTSPLAFGVPVFARPPLPRPASADPVVGLAEVVVVEVPPVLLVAVVVVLLDCAIELVLSNAPVMATNAKTFFIMNPFCKILGLGKFAPHINLNSNFLFFLNL